jgi:hypothetical protein
LKLFEKSDILSFMTRPSLEASKSNKMRTVRYKREVVFNEAKKNHQEAFKNLSHENRSRYFKCAAAATKITQNFCTEHKITFERYQIHLWDANMTGGQYIVGEKRKKYLENTSNQNYVQITNKVVEEFDDTELTITMVHEYLGHALMANTDMKAGETLSLMQSGPSFRRSRSFEAVLDAKVLKKIKDKVAITLKPEKTSEELKVCLSDVEIGIMKSFMEEGDPYNHYPPLIERAELSLSKSPVQKIAVETSYAIGRGLDEGITDYFAVKLCTDGQEQFDKYKNSERAYTQFIDNILGIKKFIQTRSTFSDFDFEQMLVDVKQTNNVGEMAKIISEKSGVQIPCTELFKYTILLDPNDNN